MRMTMPFIGLLLTMTLPSEAGSKADNPQAPGAAVVVSCPSALENLATPSLFLMGPSENKSNQGWFGVALGVPGPALSKQLNLDDTGLVVLNVGRESPADQSGLQQYDVIVSFDDQEVGHDVSALAGRILDLGSGTEVDYEVFREAQKLEMHVTLGTRPDCNDWNWKYETTPERLLKKNYFISQKVLRRGPNGEIIIEDLGQEPGAAKDFLRVIIPDYRTREIELWNQDGRTRRKCVVVKDQVTIEIEDGGEGQITIRRITREGDSQIIQEKAYESEEALKDADPEAYQIYKDSRSGKPSSRLVPCPEGNFKLPPISPLLELEEKTSRLEKLKEWRGVMAEALKEFEEQAKEKTHEQMERWEESIGQARERLKEAIDKYNLAIEDTKYRFREEADGTISVTVRRGDSELTRVYESAEALQEKNPSLFERYQKLQASE